LNYRSLSIACAVSAFAVVAVPGADAGVIYGFYCLTDTNPINAVAGEAQLTVEVNAVGLNQVSFTFANAGPLAMSITDVYFDDGSLLGIASIVEGPGVAYSQNATPPNLPGGNTANPPFQVTAGFSADSDPPAQPNGVNPGEFLVITFNLINGQTFNDVITELDTADELRIGIHVQGFSDGGSESFINVPAPGSMGLLALAVGVAARRRRSVRG